LLLSAAVASHTFTEVVLLSIVIIQIRNSKPETLPIDYFYKNFLLKSILNQHQISLTIKRLANQILENNLQLQNTVLIGIQPRGIFLSDRIVKELASLPDAKQVQYGKLDITFYRDDVRKELHVPNQTDIRFSIEGKKVVLIDDVLYTGRTIRAALDALMDFGRPEKVELLVLIDRRYSRQLPIQPDYTGKSIDSIVTQKVKVFWSGRDDRDEVVLID
jgi:pyrimidine operon attenuation protein/uracil phosphoribosyltransferase